MVTMNKMLVEFLVGGAQKGGTTTLDDYLRHHPEIGMATIKEVHFFDNELQFEKNEPDYSEYHRHFQKNPAKSQIKYGEATPIYMYWNEAPSRIHQYNPAMKWIILLRNPIERAHSHWNMERIHGTDELDFLVALLNEPSRCQAAQPLQHRNFSYIDRGRYAGQLKRIYSLFPRSQILVRKSEDLFESPNRLIQETCDFLGVQTVSFNAPIHHHALPYAAPMKREEWSYLEQMLEPEIRSLEELLQWDCAHWLKPPATLI